MKYKEFGAGNPESIIMLHGGAMSWWNYRAQAQLLENEYHIIIPLIDGHAGSGRAFESIESCAAELISFTDENLGGSAAMICGLSLGGQILLEMLSQRGDICRHAIIESAMAIPSALTHALIRPAFSCSYPLIKHRRFARMQFRQYRMNEEFFEDYYRDTCATDKRDMIAFLRANTAYKLKDAIKDCTADVHIYYGTKENRGIKRSAQLIHSALPGSTLTALDGLYHGEFSFNCPEEYAETVRNIIGE